ncbi:MAG: glycosyltransferase family 39 protein [Candidatus Atribacteria bacterium]|nr:glycosyltransferase family 39 protein [Candidatus Atribacteria bacterium]
MNTTLSGGWDYPKAWYVLGLASGTILALKLAFAWSLPGPWFLPDEVIYVDHARHIASAGTVFYQGPITGVQPAWPALLVPIELICANNPSFAYFLGTSLSSLLGTAILIPVFLIARRRLPEGEAIALAILAALLPGTCLYGWTLLTETAFALALLCSAAWFVRALHTEHCTDFAGSAVLAGLSFWIRPFGLGVVLACLAGTVLWGIGARRWRVPAFTILSVCIVIGSGMVCKSIQQPGHLGITNYSGEAETVVGWMTQGLARLQGWEDLGLAFLRESAYQMVATYGLFLPLTVGLAVHAVSGLSQLSLRGKVLLVSSATLFASMYGLTSLALMNAEGLTRMYGRYVEPLTPVLLVIGGSAWAEVDNLRGGKRMTVAITLVMVVLLGLAIPTGLLSFANNPGFWYWHLIYRHTSPMIALTTLAAVGVGLVLLSRRRLIALVLLVAGATASTVLVAHHTYRYNVETQPVRAVATKACEAVKNETSLGRHVCLWVDPATFIRLGELAPGLHQMISWLMYGLPGTEVRIADRQQVVNAGDLLLTNATDTDMPEVWREGRLGIYRVQTPSHAPLYPSDDYSAGDRTLLTTPPAGN